MPRPLDNPLTLNYADDGPGSVQGKLMNNGKTIGFTVAGPGITLTGGIFNTDTFTLKQFHLHFGCLGQKGSEHTLNGEAFAGEVFQLK